MNLSFCPLASGSSGNATYIKSGNTKILVDAGLSGVRIEKALDSIGADGKGLDAIFITHAHQDHIHGAGVLSRRYKIPVFASTGTWEAIDEKKAIGKIENQFKRYIHIGEKETFKDFIIDSFHLSHDCYEPTGYTFETEKFKAGVATDLGIVTDEVKKALENVEVLLVEANHDIDMLTYGPYPYFLKERVKGNKGHLSNIACGQLLKDLEVNNKEDKNRKLQKVYLGHLSKENNTPKIAYETVERILGVSNIDLSVASRHEASQLTSFIHCEKTNMNIDISELNDDDKRQMKLFAD